MVVDWFVKKYRPKNPYFDPYVFFVKSGFSLYVFTCFHLSKSQEPSPGTRATATPCRSWSCPPGTSGAIRAAPSASRAKPRRSTRRTVETKRPQLRSCFVGIFQTTIHNYTLVCLKVIFLDVVF